MIPQYEPIIDYTDVNRKITKYLLRDKGWVTEYKHTQELEKMLADFIGVKHFYLVNNGTISLSLALSVMGVKPYDEVLVPNLTMIATPNAVKFIGAVPVFVDVEKESGLMDLEQAKKKITPNTKAMIFVTLNGNCNLEVTKFCKDNNLYYISDDAQSLGSRYSDNTMIGTRGDISSFSFSMPKIITMGQGGGLCTNDDTIGMNIKRMKDFGRDGGGNDIHNYFGINSKVTEFQSLLGISQFSSIKSRIAKKKEIYSSYYNKLKEIKDITFLETNLEYSVPWFVDIYTNRKKELSQFLKHNEIGTRDVYPPITSQKIYSTDETFANSNLLSNKGLWLPSSLSLKGKDIEYICNKIKEFFHHE